MHLPAQLDTSVTATLASWQPHYVLCFVCSPLPGNPLHQTVVLQTARTGTSCLLVLCHVSQG